MATTLVAMTSTDIAHEQCILAKLQSQPKVHWQMWPYHLNEHDISQSSIKHTVLRRMCGWQQMTIIVYTHHTAHFTLSSLTLRFIAEHRLRFLVVWLVAWGMRLMGERCIHGIRITWRAITCYPALQHQPSMLCLGYPQPHRHHLWENIFLFKQQQQHQRNVAKPKV